MLFKQKAKEIIPQRVKHYAALHNLNYQKIKINSAKKRLGSCSSRGNLNFSWRIVLAPPLVIDYIVCHELAHLIERNHSAKYWRVVEKIFPKHKECKKWLKEKGCVRIGTL
jgi:predicted metal-dependent hydrolase